MPHRLSPCHHRRSTFAWFSQKTGSLGEVPTSMSPPTQRWTRLCRRGPPDHPSRRLRKLNTVVLHGDRSYWEFARASLTWATSGSVVDPLGSRPRRRTSPVVDRRTKAPVLLLKISAFQLANGPLRTRLPRAGSPSVP